MNSVGDVVGCLQLQSIVSLPSHAPGFADTPNAGGEYKVDLMGFPVKWTPAEYLNLAVIGGQTYTAREYQPVQANWCATTPMPISTSPSYLNQATVALDPDHRYQAVEFGNVCTGAGGGLTIGFWSNKNGLAAMKAPNSVNILAGLRALKLVDAQGKDFDPWQYDDQIRTWLLGATAQNMAYMLSAQLAAMYLNVNANPGTHVDPNAMIYAAGAPGANVAGFASVGTVMAAAQALLLKSPYTPAGSIYRAEQESVKNALDMANSNRTFVMPNQCTFSFAPLM